MKRLILLVFIILNVSSIIYGQTSLSGQLTQVSNGQVVFFASVALYKNSVLIAVVESDLDGYYHFSKIDPGKYKVEASFLGLETTNAEIQVRAGKINPLDIEMKEGEVLIDYARYCCCKILPTVDIEKTSEVLASKEIEKNSNPKTVVEEEVFEFNMYPNPAINILKIRSGSHFEKLLITDMNGHIVVEKYSDSFIEKIPVHNLTSGLYIIVLQKSNGKLKSKLLMINSN